MRSLKSLAFGSAFVLATVCSWPAPLQAQANPCDGEASLLLQNEELTAAAAECGIGIAGERIDAVATAAIPGPAVGIAKWVAGLVAGHVKGVITRRLGLDEEYNRFLALSRQLRQIEGQLKALDEKFDQLGDQIRLKEFRQLRLKLAERFVDPVVNGTDRLRVFACEEAAALNAERMKLDPKVIARAQLDRDRALAAFGKTCEQMGFENIPRDLTAHFKSDESILHRYLDAVILPRRYLTRQDSQDLDDFFYRYHLIQIEALRLTAECELRFPPAGVDPDDANLHASVADSVYCKPSSEYQRAQMAVLPEIRPPWLPEDVILDKETGLLWWNGLDYGAHPFVNRRGLIQDHTIALEREVDGPKGAWRFELAKINEIEKLAAFNAAMPQVRRSRTDSGRYPATLKPFLKEIGLDKIAEKIPETGNLSFVWTSDGGKPIRRCHTLGRLRCLEWYDRRDTLGQTAGTAPANRPGIRASSGNIWYAPLQCVPDKCVADWDRNPGVVSLCKDPAELDGTNRCVSDAVLGMWRAPGIYRSAQRADDRFFAFDLSPLP